MSDYDPLLRALEVDWQARHGGVRQLLYEKGRPDLVAELDAKMKLIANGIDGAQRTWHSISEAQRGALAFARDAGRLVCRNGRYQPVTVLCGCPLIGKPTMRNLCSRELMAWDGGAFDPEGAALITERGLFVLKHRPPNIA